MSLQCDSAEVTNEIRLRAQETAKRLSFNDFIEVSAKDNLGVEDMFEKAVSLVNAVISLLPYKQKFW